MKDNMTINDDGTWAYDEDTVMKIAEPTPNLLAR